MIKIKQRAKYKPSTHAWYTGKDYLIVDISAGVDAYVSSLGL